jgi:hypothetical protein
MRSKTCDTYGNVAKYDMRRPTHPYSGKRREVYQEGYSNLRPLPSLSGPCPCSVPKVDVEMPYYKTNEDGTKSIAYKTVAVPDTYRNCCLKKNRVHEKIN